ncbi:MAG: hypothetical protein H6573_08495 [Lewinellaceae bacterium]|nr:hypothetical protein [Lewinellaceae bacterium]
MKCIQAYTIPAISPSTKEETAMPPHTVLDNMVSLIVPRGINGTHSATASMFEGAGRS